MGVALYPGSFDPIHNGHIAVIESVSEVFERVVVAVANNSRKVGFAPAADRVSLIEQSTKHLSNIEVVMFSGLTIDIARELQVSCLVKGVRNTSDFDDEMAQAAMNAASGSARTLLVPGFGSHGLVSSRFVREIAAKGGDVSDSVPPPVVEYLSSSNPSRQV